MNHPLRPYRLRITLYGTNVLLLFSAAAFASRLAAADLPPRSDAKPFVMIPSRDQNTNHQVVFSPDGLKLRPHTFKVGTAADLEKGLAACKVAQDGHTIAAVVKLNEQVDWSKVFTVSGEGKKQDVTLYIPADDAAWLQVSRGHTISLDFTPAQRTKFPQASELLTVNYEMVQKGSSQPTDAKSALLFKRGMESVDALARHYAVLSRSISSSEVMFDADAPIYLLDGINAVNAFVGDVATGKALFDESTVLVLERQVQVVGSVQPMGYTDFFRNKDNQRVPVHVVTKDRGKVIPDLEVRFCNQISYDLKKMSDSASFDCQTSPAKRSFAQFSYCIWAVDPKTKAVISEYKIVQVSQKQVDLQGIQKVDLEVTKVDP